jgi:hypothetical protein
MIQKIYMPLLYLLMVSGTSLLLTCAFSSLSDPADAIAITPDDIKISEVMTSNSTTLTDQFNETPDWIELYNSGDTAIDLAGYGLSDKPDNPGNWTCGPMLLGAGTYAIICASGNDITLAEPGKAEEIVMMNTAISAWADSQNVTPGKSFVRAMRFSPKVFGVVDGKKIISAKMYLDDNAGVLNWQTAKITMDCFRPKTTAHLIKYASSARLKRVNG